MSKRKCPIENCCNADCHQSQKEIIGCRRRSLINEKKIENIDNRKRMCYRCGRNIEEDGIYYIIDDGFYVCLKCYDLYHKPKYNQIQFDAVVDDFIKNQNEKAIECLKEVLEHFTNRPTYFDVARLEYQISDQDKKFIDYVNNKIKELEEENG